MIDYKEYVKQMRENAVITDGIVQVSEELWYQIADVIEKLAEKQMPKKPRVIHWNLQANDLYEYYCPKCSERVYKANKKIYNSGYKYCCKCGQALDWGQEE